MRNRYWAIPLILAAAAACSSDNGDNGNGNGTTPENCSIVLSGGLTGTYACSSLAAVYTADNSRSTVGITFNGGPTVTASFQVAGTFNTGTVASTVTGVVAATSVVSGNNIWSQSQTLTGTPVGTASLTLSQATAGTASAGSYIYTVHGTLNVTMPPVGGTGATGNVTAVISF